RRGAGEPLELLSVDSHRLAPELPPHVPAAQVPYGADQPEPGLPDVLPPGDQGQQRVLHQVLAVRQGDAISLERLHELRPYALEDRRDVGRPFRMIPIDHGARSRHRRPPTPPAALRGPGS